MYVSFKENTYILLEYIGAQGHRHTPCMSSNLLMGQGNEMIFNIFIKRLYMTLTKKSKNIPFWLQIYGDIRNKNVQPTILNS
jgi:hypothetical protein